MADKDKIISKNRDTQSYVNGRGEHLKFTDRKMSIYSNDPRESHKATHIVVNHEKSTYNVITHGENKKDRDEGSGSCYLTTACMKHFQENFDDNCYELTVLRWFRDNFVAKEDIKHYYEIAPLIVKGIDLEEKSDMVYDYIYDNVVDYCVKRIEQGNYEDAYKRYKDSILVFEEYYARPILMDNLTNNLKLVRNKG